MTTYGSSTMPWSGSGPSVGPTPTSLHPPGARGRGRIVLSLHMLRECSTRGSRWRPTGSPANNCCVLEAIRPPPSSTIGCHVRVRVREHWDAICSHVRCSQGCSSALGLINTGVRGYWLSILSSCTQARPSRQARSRVRFYMRWFHEASVTAFYCTLWKMGACWRGRGGGGGGGLKQEFPRTLVNSGVAISRSPVKLTPGAQVIAECRVDSSKASSSQSMCVQVVPDAVPKGYEMYMEEADATTAGWRSRRRRSRTTTASTPEGQQETTGECKKRPNLPQHLIKAVGGECWTLPILMSPDRCGHAALHTWAKRADEPRGRTTDEQHKHMD